MFRFKNTILGLICFSIFSNAAMINNTIFLNNILSLSQNKWSKLGESFSVSKRDYNNHTYIYSANRENRGGIYQSFSTEVGQRYNVTAILLGTDVSKKENFSHIAASYITIDDKVPSPSVVSNYSSEKVVGSKEKSIAFEFTATASTSYLSLRSTQGWNYASARDIRIDKVDSNKKKTFEKEKDTISVGGIPKRKGHNKYQYTENLKKTNYKGMGYKNRYTHLLTEDNQKLIIENRYFSGDPTTRSTITIKGKVGKNQTVIIRASKFENIDAQAIYINEVDSIIIEGNYFDRVLHPVILHSVKNIEIKYNKVKNHAVSNKTCQEISSKKLSRHVFVVSGAKNINKLEIAYNLIDRSDAPYNPKWTKKDKYKKSLAMDYINLRRVSMLIGKRGEIHHNIIAGSENIGEALYGGGIITDDDSHNIYIHHNVVYNATQGAFTSANSDNITIADNIGLYTKRATKNILPCCYNKSVSLDTPVYSNALIIADYKDGDIGRHILKNNRFLGYGRDKNRYWKIIGRITSKEKTRIEGDSSYITLQNNNFIWQKSANNILKIRKGKGNYKTYLNIDESRQHTPSNSEVTQLIFGMDYHPGMVTNNAMFKKWGTADNHEIYFDEKRVVK